MTKMLKRADVISVVSKQIARQWEIANLADSEGDRIRYRHTRSRLDMLRIIREMIHELPAYVTPEYASDDAIPSGSEWSERIRLAGEMTDAPNGADPAMLRLLGDLRKPLDELHRLEDEMDMEQAA